MCMIDDVCICFNDGDYSLDYTAADFRIMNWKGCGSKRSWPILMHYSGIRLEGIDWLEISTYLLYYTYKLHSIWFKATQKAFQSHIKSQIFGSPPTPFDLY
jgi:hypothetical protein